MAEALGQDGFLDVLSQYPHLLLEGMELWDWGFIVGCILWLCILLMPLKNTDRRDIPSGLLFGLYGTLVGVAFFFVIPEQSEKPSSYLLYVCSSVFFAFLFLARWFWNYRPAFQRTPPLEPEDTVSPKS